VTAYENIIASLRNEIQEKTNKYHEEKMKTDSQIRDLSFQFTKEKEALMKCKEELASRPTKQQWKDMKKRLKVVERVAFPFQLGRRRGDNGNSADIDDDNEEEIEEEDEDPELTTKATSSLSVASQVKAKQQSLGNHRDLSEIPLETLLTNKIHNLEKDLLETKKGYLSSKETESNQRDVINTLKKAVDNKNQLIQRFVRVMCSFFLSFFVACLLASFFFLSFSHLLSFSPVGWSKKLKQGMSR
jgi:hypothetical protein